MDSSSYPNEPVNGPESVAWKYNVQQMYGQPANAPPWICGFSDVCIPQQPQQPRVPPPQPRQQREGGEPLKSDVSQQHFVPSQQFFQQSPPPYYQHGVPPPPGPPGPLPGPPPGPPPNAASNCSIYPPNTCPYPAWQKPANYYLSPQSIYNLPYPPAQPATTSMTCIPGTTPPPQPPAYRKTAGMQNSEICDCDFSMPRYAQQMQPQIQIKQSINAFVRTNQDSCNDFDSPVNCAEPNRVPSNCGNPSCKAPRCPDVPPRRSNGNRNSSNRSKSPQHNRASVYRQQANSASGASNRASVASNRASVATNRAIYASNNSSAIFSKELTKNENQEVEESEEEPPHQSLFRHLPDTIDPRQTFSAKPLHRSVAAAERQNGGSKDKAEPFSLNKHQNSEKDTSDSEVETKTGYNINPVEASTSTTDLPKGPDQSPEKKTGKQTLNDKIYRKTEIAAADPGGNARGPIKTSPTYSNLPKTKDKEPLRLVGHATQTSGSVLEQRGQKKAPSNFVINPVTPMERISHSSGAASGSLKHRQMKTTPLRDSLKSPLLQDSGSLLSCCKDFSANSSRKSKIQTPLASPPPEPREFFVAKENIVSRHTLAKLETLAQKPTTTSRRQQTSLINSLPSPKKTKDSSSDESPDNALIIEIELKDQAKAKTANPVEQSSKGTTRRLSVPGTAQSHAPVVDELLTDISNASLLERELKKREMTVDRKQRKTGANGRQSIAGSLESIDEELVEDTRPKKRRDSAERMKARAEIDSADEQRQRKRAHYELENEDDDRIESERKSPKDANDLERERREARKKSQKDLHASDLEREQRLSHNSQDEFYNDNETEPQQKRAREEPSHREKRKTQDDHKKRERSLTREQIDPKDNQRMHRRSHEQETTREERLRRLTKEQMDKRDQQRLRRKSPEDLGNNVIQGQRKSPPEDEKRERRKSRDRMENEEERKRRQEQFYEEGVQRDRRYTREQVYDESDQSGRRNRRASLDSESHRRKLREQLEKEDARRERRRKRIEYEDEQQYRTQPLAQPVVIQPIMPQNLVPTQYQIPFRECNCPVQAANLRSCNCGQPQQQQQQQQQILQPVQFVAQVASLPCQCNASRPRIQQQKPDGRGCCACQPMISNQDSMYSHYSQLTEASATDFSMDSIESTQKRTQPERKPELTPEREAHRSPDYRSIDREPQQAPEREPQRAPTREPERELEREPERIAEQKIEKKTEREPDPDPDPDPDPELESESEPHTDPEPEPQPNPSPEPEPDPKLMQTSLDSLLTIETKRSQLSQTSQEETMELKKSPTPSLAKPKPVSPSPQRVQSEMRTNKAANTLRRPSTQRSPTISQKSVKQPFADPRKSKVLPPIKVDLKKKTFERGSPITARSKSAVEKSKTRPRSKCHMEQDCRLMPNRPCGEDCICEPYTSNPLERARRIRAKAGKALSTHSSLETMPSNYLQDVKHAIDLENQVSRNKMDDHTLIIRFPDPEINTEEIKSQVPGIENIYFQQSPMPRYGFVQLSPEADAEEAIQAICKISFGNGFLLAERARLAAGGCVNSLTMAELNNIDPYTLYIGNLPMQNSSQLMKEEFPNAKRVDVGYSAKMKKTRYAFVRFHTFPEARRAFQHAIRLQFDSRPAIVRFKRIRTNLSKKNSKSKFQALSRKMFKTAASTSTVSIGSRTEESDNGQLLNDLLRQPLPASSSEEDEKNVRVIYQPEVSTIDNSNDDETDRDNGIWRIVGAPANNRPRIKVEHFDSDDDDSPGTSTNLLGLRYDSRIEEVKSEADDELESATETGQTGKLATEQAAEYESDFQNSDDENDDLGNVAVYTQTLRPIKLELRSDVQLNPENICNIETVSNSNNEDSCGVVERKHQPQICEIVSDLEISITQNGYSTTTTATSTRTAYLQNLYATTQEYRKSQRGNSEYDAIYDQLETDDDDEESSLA